MNKWIKAAIVCCLILVLFLSIVMYSIEHKLDEFDVMIENISNTVKTIGAY